MVGRPASAEAAPYYFTYIDQVSGEDPVAALKAQALQARTLFSQITEEKSLFRYAPEKWSIRQVVNHLADTERAFAFRALWFARGFTSPLPSFDQEIAAAGAQADRRPWIAHCEEFEAVRQSTLSLFCNLPEDAWLRGGTASNVHFSVRALAFISAGHVAHHLRLLCDRYLP